jgi:hypothetical protein
MKRLSLVPEEPTADAPAMTGEELRAKLLDLVDLLKGCATSVDGAAQTALACARADPAQPVGRFDVALDAIATGSSSLRSMLESFRIVVAELQVTTSPRPPAT